MTMSSVSAKDNANLRDCLSPKDFSVGISFDDRDIHRNELMKQLKHWSIDENCLHTTLTFYRKNSLFLFRRKEEVLTQSESYPQRCVWKTWRNESVLRPMFASREDVSKMCRGSRLRMVFYARTSQEDNAHRKETNSKRFQNECRIREVVGRCFRFALSFIPVFSECSLPSSLQVNIIKWLTLTLKTTGRRHIHTHTLTLHFRCHTKSTSNEEPTKNFLNKSKSQQRGRRVSVVFITWKEGRTFKQLHVILHDYHSKCGWKKNRKRRWTTGHEGDCKARSFHTESKVQTWEINVWSLQSTSVNTLSFSHFKFRSLLLAFLATVSFEVSPTYTLW